MMVNEEAVVLDYDPRALGLLVRQFRDERNLSVRKGADKLFLPHSSIQRVEGGLSRRPRPKTLTGLSLGMGMPIQDLCARIGVKLTAQLLSACEAQVVRLIGVKVTDCWRTPPEVFAYWARRYNITADLASVHTHALCPRFIGPDQNSLDADWLSVVGEGNAGWLNPPYGGPGCLPWVEKAIAEQQRGVTTILLIPPSMGTRYMEFCLTLAAVCDFYRGRLAFLHPLTWLAAGANRGDSCVAVFEAGHTGPPREMVYLDRPRSGKAG